MPIILKNKGDLILSFAAFFQVAVLMLQELLISSSIVEYDSFHNYSILIAAMPTSVALFYIIKRKPLLLLITYFIILYLTLITLIFFPVNEEYLKDGQFYLFCVNIPSFLCLASIRDISALKKVMLLISYVVFFLGIVYFSFLFIGKITFLKYSMTFSYYLLFPALVFISQKKIQYTLLFLIICIFILLIGSRGPLLIALGYALLITLIDRKKRMWMIITIAILAISATSIYTLFIIIIDRLDIKSRTLNMLIEGNITDSTNRFTKYLETWDSIKKNPFFGNGLFGDRVVLKNHYCHNIFLEMSINFGLLLGSLLFIYIIYTTIKIYKNSTGDGKNLLLWFFFYGFIPLMFSGSYLINAGFGLFIGYLYLIQNKFHQKLAN